MKSISTAAAAAVLFLGGCSYQASAPVSPAYDVYSNYPDKIPGRFALHVDADDLNGEARVRGLSCSAHTYTVEGESAFVQSTLRTIENLVRSVQLVDDPLDRANMLAGGYDGMVMVNVEDFDASVQVIPGFWTSTMEADVDLAAGVTVDGTDGRLMGTTVSASEDAESASGGSCGIGAEAASEATGAAIEELMGRLGERLTNSQRVRDAFAGEPTA